MKALEILKEKREICVRIFEGDDYSDGLDYYENKIIKLDEAIAELEALETKDTLAELEKVILDYYLVKGYHVGVGGWEFVINISTSYKQKEIHVMFKQDTYSRFESVFMIEKKSTKEMFDAAFEYFSIKEPK